MIEAEHIACHHLYGMGWDEGRIARALDITTDAVRMWLNTPVPEV